MEFSRPDTAVGSLSLLQGIFPTQGLNGLPHCRWTVYQLSHEGSPQERERRFNLVRAWSLHGRRPGEGSNMEGGEGSESGRMLG